MTQRADLGLPFDQGLAIISSAMALVDHWYSLPTEEIVRRDVKEARLIAALAEAIGVDTYTGPVI